MIPHDFSGMAWWAFNFVLLILVGWAKMDLGEIKSDTKKNRELQEANAADIKEHKGICEERHKRLDYEILEMKKGRQK